MLKLRVAENARGKGRGGGEKGTRREMKVGGQDLLTSGKYNSTHNINESRVEGVQRNRGGIEIEMEVKKKARRNSTVFGAGRTGGE